MISVPPRVLSKDRSNKKKVVAGDSDGDSDSGTDLCYGIGAGCTTGIDCCSGLCEKDMTGKFVCVSNERCAPVGGHQQ